MMTHSKRLIALVAGIIGSGLLAVCVIALLSAILPVEEANAAVEIQPPDRFEPNDVPAQAKGVESSPMVSLTFSVSPSLSQDDKDWYNISINANFLMTITASVEGSSTGLRVSGFSGDGATPVGTRLTDGGTSTYIITNTGGFQTFKFLVENLVPTSDGRYRIEYATAPASLQATSTPVPQGISDPFEPNDNPQEVLARSPAVVGFININSIIGQRTISTDFLNFFPPTRNPPIPITANGVNGDQDWFFFYARRHISSGGSGGTYRIGTTVTAGVDTELALFRDQNCTSPSGNLEQTGGGPSLFGFNDDAGTGKRESQIEFNSDSDCIYWVRLLNKDPTPRGANQTYAIGIFEIVGTPSPTNSPAPTIPATAFPQGIDSFEYNGDFDRSTLIAPGVKYSNLNFVPFQPPSADTVDNDFFRIPVKQGIYYTCETLDLAAGVDTNMIVYNQDRAGIGGNDDTSTLERAQGKFGSRVTWLAGYTGIAYILIGEVSPPRPNEAQARTYALQCIIGIPNTPTPIGGPPTPTTVPTPFVPPTELPPDPTMTPFPTPRTAQNLPVRKLPDGQIPGRGPNVPTPEPTATPRPVALDMQIFNDTNRNGLLDPGEGINGTSIRILDEASGTPLGQTMTDSEGRARFTIFNEGPVRVSVPMFGYSTLINEVQATVRIALTPSEQLPARIP
jgi:hypothetical protein